MRKNVYSFLALAAAALLVPSCSNNDSDNSQAEAAKYITVSPTIGQMTRLVTNSDGSQDFANGDKISVYAWTGTATGLENMVVNGSINTYDGTSKWTASPQMLWKDMTTPHYFLSVYPARTITSFADDPYTLDVNDVEGSDMLVATNLTGLTATSNPVDLTFNHVMAKLIVNLSFRNQWNDGSSTSPVIPTVESVTATAMTEATVNYVTADGTEVTPTGTATDIALPATTANTKYTAIMVPQTGFNTIKITIDGKAYTFTHTEDIPLASGKYTTVNLIVGRDQIDVGTVSINDWQEGSNITGGEAQAD